MADPKEEIIEMINKALELEHMARIQYLSHAEAVDGMNAEPIIARLKELSDDEKKHEDKFRKILGDYLDGVPTVKIAGAKTADTVKEIIEMNLKDEKTAIDYYKKVLEKVKEKRKDLPYSFMQLEHELRHIIMDEMEHIAELRTLLKLSIEDVENMETEEVV